MLPLTIDLVLEELVSELFFQFCDFDLLAPFWIIPYNSVVQGFKQNNYFYPLLFVNDFRKQSQNLVLVLRIIEKTVTSEANQHLIFQLTYIFDDTLFRRVRSWQFQYLGNLFYYFTKNSDSIQ